MSIHLPCRIGAVFALVVFAPLLAADALPEGKAFTNSLGMQLVRIDAGSFIMGQGESPPQTRAEWDERDWDESPAHKVVISKAFFMGATEVAHGQYEKFDAEHAKLRGKFGAGKADDEPVTHVSFEQAAAFCKWLSEKEGRPYRLPTEAEWEYACRAGTATLFNTGDTITPQQANLAFRSLINPKRQVQKVGSFPANPWGLFDMHGNVAEWCGDWYGPYAAGEQTDPVGSADGVARVVRGWSFLSVSHAKGPARYARSANRSGHLPDDANKATGFRVVLGELPKTKALAVGELPLNQRDVKKLEPTLPRPLPKREGSKAAEPLFIDYTKAKKTPVVPKEMWGPIYGAWNHYATVVACPNGDMLAVWYSTVQEEGRECAQAASRLRVGADAWEPASSFLQVPDVNAHAPVLLTDGKRLYHFFTQSLAGWDDAAEGMRYSDDSGATWSKPRIIVPREHPRRMSQPCSAFVARDGKLVVALDGDDGHRDERIMLSGDRGATWHVAGGCLRKAAGKYAIHPAIAQRADGSIVAFLRGPDPMPAFITTDEGETWTPLETPFPGISVGQKAAAVKLAGGALLLMSIDNKKKIFGGSTFAALSLDDGKTWPHVRAVQGVTGYMSAAQAADGTIFVFGSRSSCVAFNEAWVREGKRAEGN